MAHYRLYLLNIDDHIDCAIDLECDADNKLDDSVGEYADGRAMEVWQGTRVVRKYSMEEAAAFLATRQSPPAAGGARRGLRQIADKPFRLVQVQVPNLKPTLECRDRPMSEGSDIPEECPTFELR